MVAKWPTGPREAPSPLARSARMVIVIISQLESVALPEDWARARTIGLGAFDDVPSNAWIWTAASTPQGSSSMGCMRRMGVRIVWRGGEP
jgi:hypothetical protein